MASTMEDRDVSKNAEMRKWQRHPATAYPQLQDATTRGQNSGNVVARANDTPSRLHCRILQGIQYYHLNSGLRGGIRGGVAEFDARADGGFADAVGGSVIDTKYYVLFSYVEI